MNTENVNAGRFIKISDSLNETMRDEIDFNCNKYPSIGGLLLVKNSRGDVLLRKNNLVVFRGRLFALENIFKQSFNAPYNYIQGNGLNNIGNERGSNPADIRTLVLNENIAGDLSGLLNRKVCLFGIGSGGISNQSWFSPNVVAPSSTGLEHPIEFCKVNDDDYNFKEPNEGAIVGRSHSTFYHANSDGDCFYKRLNTKDASDHFCPQWVFDTVTNTIAMMCTLHIDEKHLTNPADGVPKRINELALFMANESTSNGVTTFSDIEMFSRITFDTESLYANKELVIEYYIFA